LANDISVLPEVLRTFSPQQGRENVEYNSAEAYYRRIAVLLLLDHLIQQTQERFGGHQIFVSKLLNLVPSLLCEESAASLSFDELIEKYRDDLSHPVVVDTEMFRWKMKWPQQSAEDCPSTLNLLYLCAKKEFFPNSYTCFIVNCARDIMRK